REQQGRLSESLEACDRAVEGFRAIHSTAILGYALTRRAIVLGEMGDFSRAQRDMAEAEEIVRSGSREVLDLRIRCFLSRARLLCYQGAWRKAVDTVRRAAREPGSKDSSVGVLVQSQLCDAMSGSGQAGAAIEQCHQALEESTRLAVERVSARASLAEA